MASREELVASAVTFLQNPSVAMASLEQKTAFLQSKNLSPEEIDLALLRASQQVPPQVSQYQQQVPVPQDYPYGRQHQFAPDLVTRDWRDWFIVSTIVGGVGYGLYALAQRYIIPLIAPPTTPQLQQDKESIDAEFEKAFALIEQVSSDTATLKKAEEKRSQQLDVALREVESVVQTLKASSRHRDDDIRRITEEIGAIKETIPKAIEGERKGNERKLNDLTGELKSLKILIGNRLNAISSNAAASSTAQSGSSGDAAQGQITNSPGPVTQTPSLSQQSTPDKSSPSLPRTAPTASIPEWQKAASTPKDNNNSDATSG